MSIFALNNTLLRSVKTTSLMSTIWAIKKKKTMIWIIWKLSAIVKSNAPNLNIKNCFDHENKTWYESQTFKWITSKEAEVDILLDEKKSKQQCLVRGHISKMKLNVPTHQCDISIEDDGIMEIAQAKLFSS